MPRYILYLLIVSQLCLQARMCCFELEGQQVFAQEIIPKNDGRIRDVKTGPEGAIYDALNQPDQILRLIPTGKSNPIPEPIQARTRHPKESPFRPKFFVAPGIDPTGTLVPNYQRGLNYAIEYFGNYGPFNIYLLGPASTEDILSIYQARARTRVVPNSNLSPVEQINAFLRQPNFVEEMRAVLAGEASGGLTWTPQAHRIYEDVTTNASKRARDPIENTWGALHEYHHVFQVAHDGPEHDRSSDSNLNSWILEGGASYSSAVFMERLGLLDAREYMLSLRTSGANIGRPGIREYLAKNPEWQLDNESYWESSSAAQVYYMLGAWATAYLIHGLGIDEATVFRDWYNDVPSLGKKAAFIKHMKRTPKEFYAEFRGFIQQSDEEVMRLFPERNVDDPRGDHGDGCFGGPAGDNGVSRPGRRFRGRETDFFVSGCQWKAIIGGSLSVEAEFPKLV